MRIYYGENSSQAWACSLQWGELWTPYNSKPPHTTKPLITVSCKEPGQKRLPFCNYFILKLCKPKLR